MEPSPQRDHHLAIIGLGATGSCLLPLVATLPIAQITLIDGDTVEERNLIRQPLYGRDDLGLVKVKVAADRTSHLHGRRKLHIENVFADAANIDRILKDATMVADCTDDIHARSLIDKTCERLKVPLFTAAIHGSHLQVISLHIGEDDRRSLSLRSFFPGSIGNMQDACDMTNVPIEVPAIAAALLTKRIEAFMNGEHIQGSFDLLDVHRGSWMRIAAPGPDDELIA